MMKSTYLLTPFAEFIPRYKQKIVLNVAIVINNNHLQLSELISTEKSVFIAFVSLNVIEFLLLDNRTKKTTVGHVIYEVDNMEK